MAIRDYISKQREKFRGFQKKRIETKTARFKEDNVRLKEDAKLRAELDKQRKLRSDLKGESPIKRQFVNAGRRISENLERNKRENTGLRSSGSETSKNVWTEGDVVKPGSGLKDSVFSKRR